jgi:hypothetical protein
MFPSRFFLWPFVVTRMVPVISFAGRTTAGRNVQTQDSRRLIAQRTLSFLWGGEMRPVWPFNARKRKNARKSQPFHHSSISKKVSSFDLRYTVQTSSSNAQGTLNALIWLCTGGDRSRQHKKIWTFSRTTTPKFGSTLRDKTADKYSRSPIIGQCP